MTAKEIIRGVNAYIEQSGYRCKQNLVENFYLGLKTKACVVLAGNSGVEKHRLAQLFARAVGATEENGRYKMLPVQPDWLAASDLLGRVNLEGMFLPGAVLDFFKQAQSDQEHPYFLCLDRINLSSVEYYLKDIVAGLEKRTEQQKKPLITEKYYGQDTEAARTYGDIYVGQNLYVICTVNMDEASYPLNQRFLDRVHTMLLEKEDLVQECVCERRPEEIKTDNAFLLPCYRQIIREGEHWEFVLKYFGVFQQINSILVKARAYAEYTLRDDAILYLLHNLNEDVLPENGAMDFMFLQKILPRVQGSRKMVGQTIGALFEYCAGPFADQPGDSDSAKMAAVLTNTEAKYPVTAQKLVELAGQCERDDYASIWI